MLSNGLQDTVREILVRIALIAEVSSPIQEAALYDHVRELLVWATGFIPNEEIAGVVFGVSLIVTDHLFNIVKG